MTAQPHSPNWYWQRLGCTIERDARGTRTIRRPDGSVVEVRRDTNEDNHSAELRAAEREYRRLPHGLDECKAAQIEIF